MFLSYILDLERLLDEKDFSFLMRVPFALSIPSPSQALLPFFPDHLFTSLNEILHPLNNHRHVRVYRLYDGQKAGSWWNCPRRDFHVWCQLKASAAGDFQKGTSPGFALSVGESES